MGIIIFKNLVKGFSIGQSIRKARQKIIDKYGYGQLVWLGLSFYGECNWKIGDFKKTKKIIKIVLSVIIGLLLIIGLISTIRYNKKHPVLDNQSTNYPPITNNRTHQIETSLKKHRIAVLPFTAPGEMDLSEKLQDMVSAIIINRKNITLIERNRFNTLIKELKLSKTNYIDSNNALKIGKILSANYILYGSIAKILNNYELDYKLIKVETTEIIDMGYVSFSNLLKLRGLLNDKIKIMLKKIQ
jgi:TolB-like protein